MLNYTEQPQNSALEISIQVSSEFADQKSIEKIVEELTNTFDFEYGYVTKLPANYDSGTERKIKKGLFSTSVEVNNTDNYESFLGLLQADTIVVDSDDTSFASEKDFQTLHEAKASAWRTLPQFVIYRIQHVKKIRTPNGQDSIILYLYARNSTEPKVVWAINTK